MPDFVNFALIDWLQFGALCVVGVVIVAQWLRINVLVAERDEWREAFHVANEQRSIKSEAQDDAMQSKEA